MTRNRTNRNPKLNREQLIEINKQHISQSSLLLNHMLATQKKIEDLEEENEKLKEKLKELEEEAKKKSKKLEEEVKKKFKELEEEATKSKKLEEEAKKKSKKLEEEVKKKSKEVEDEAKKSKEMEEEAKRKNRQTLLVADSHRKTMNFREIEEELGGKLFVTPAYNSAEWPRSKIPTKSQKVVVPLMLKDAPYTDLILQLSCNDISNVDHIFDEKLKLHLAEKSSQNTVNIAVAALRENKKLQNVLILPRSPGVDSEELKLLSDHGNTAVVEAIAKSGYRQQIKLGSMSTILAKTQDQMHQVFGSRFSPRYDGLHMRGHRGQQIYTRAILESIRSNGLNFV